MLSVELDGDRAWLALDRPERRNALPATFWPRLVECLRELEADARVRAIVLHGAGPCFSVGADIGDLATGADLGERRARQRSAARAVRALEEISKPTVAAVHGHCIGGGLELTLVCDVVVCDETATFATPEAKIGLVPAILLSRGPGRVDAHWLRYLALSGETLGAEEARLAGLVNFVVPVGEHLAKGGAVATAMASAAPLAAAVIKGSPATGPAVGLEQALESASMLQGSEDFAEGAAAFLERRPPRFQGR